MSVPLTIGNFLIGYRTAAGAAITSNPFYNRLLDRTSAELYVRGCGYPVLRPSSRRGFYAITYNCRVRRMIIHSLLRQNADLSIDCLNDAGEITSYHTDLYELLEGIIWPRPAALGPRQPSRTLTELAPALVPLMPSFVRQTLDEDPC